MGAAELMTIPIDDDERALEFAAATIAVAHDKLKDGFIAYIRTVGPALLDARDRLSTGGRGSEFHKWCEESTPYSRQHCNRLIVAFETIKKVEHRCSTLPPDQKTTLELAKADDPVAVWERVITKTETPNAKDVKQEINGNPLSQREKILDLLGSKGIVTREELEAICVRYSARINELRQAGHKITTRKGGTYEYHGQGKPPDKQDTVFEDCKKLFGRMTARQKALLVNQFLKDEDVQRIRSGNVVKAQRIRNDDGKQATSAREDVEFALNKAWNTLYGCCQKYGVNRRWLSKCSEETILEMLSECKRIRTSLEQFEEFLNSK